MRPGAALLGLLLLAGCESTGFAPILDNAHPDRPAREKAKPAVLEKTGLPVETEPSQQGMHIVQKGDTLFAIAFQNGLDYRDIAFWNNLSAPDVIKVGQVLRLTAPDDRDARARGVETLPLRETALPAAKPLKEAPLFTEPRAQRLPYSEANWTLLLGAEPSVAGKPTNVVAEKPVPELVTSVDAKTSLPQTQSLLLSQPQADKDDWQWPSNGALLGAFGGAGGKGIDFAGTRQSPVMAAAPGKVVYSGSGLRGYGKMLIIKHEDEYLTAYAHNHNLLVKEGDWVKGGQKIAEMGDSDSERVKLHFEIRQFGKPIDPLTLLPERK